MPGRILNNTRWLLLALVVVAFESPVAADPPDQPADKALIQVKIPANAVLMIGDEKTAQSGSERWFVSPPLTPGKKYTYTLTATWEEKGQTVKFVKEASVSAGATTVVDFTEKVAVKPDPKPDPMPKPAPMPKPIPKPVKTAPKVRTFEFTYAATVTGLKPDQTARVWLPVPSDSDEQSVRFLAQPSDAELNTGKEYGNRMFYLNAKADAEGKIPLRMVFLITRKEVQGEVKSETGKVERFLKPDALVPLEGKPLELIKDKKLPKDQTEAAWILYEVVNNHMKYSKEGTEWGRGDAVWACDSKFGNCSDFHSLFISLARANHIPAKFEMGFPLPDKRGEGDIGGYHCWAKFKPEGKDWISVDISEANKNPKMADYYFGNLTEDRVAFSTGRDITLEPKQAAGPLNYFIYPFVEVDGKVHPQEKITKKFSFKDVK